MTAVSSKKTTPSVSKDLIVLFALPIAIAVFAALIVFVPQIGANPTQDFIYGKCQTYDCGTFYVMNAMKGKLEQRVSPDEYRRGQETLHYYSASQDSSRPLSLDEANALVLNTDSRSTDGYVLSSDNQETGFLFWSDQSNGWYLKNGLKKKHISLGDQTRGYEDIQFLGWVVK